MRNIQQIYSVSTETRRRRLLVSISKQKKKGIRCQENVSNAKPIIKIKTATRRLKQLNHQISAFIPEEEQPFFLL